MNLMFKEGYFIHILLFIDDKTTQVSYSEEKISMSNEKLLINKTALYLFIHILRKYPNSKDYINRMTNNNNYINYNITYF